MNDVFYDEFFFQKHIRIEDAFEKLKKKKNSIYFKLS